MTKEIIRIRKCGEITAVQKEYVEYVQVCKAGEFDKFFKGLHKLLAAGKNLICFDKYEESVTDVKELTFEDICKIVEDDTNRYYIYYKKKHKKKRKHKEENNADDNENGENEEENDADDDENEEENDADNDDE